MILQYGNYRSLNNGIVKGDTTLVIYFVDTVDSLFEHFFYEWMHSISTNKICNENGKWINTTGLDWPFPRIDLFINVYKDEDVIMSGIKKDNKLSQGQIKPNFKYIFTGCFPTAIDTVNINHTQIPGSGDLVRSVTFEYNNCTVIPDKYYARYYNMEF